MEIYFQKDFIESIFLDLLKINSYSWSSSFVKFYFTISLVIITS
ncbi:hypothetical protein HMPREF1864_01706, partial [Peptoniphilus sp. DNF00840]